MRGSALLLAAIALIVFLSSFFQINSPDLWWHIVNGEETLRTGKIHFADPFSHTSNGGSYPPTQWAFEVTAALLFRAFHEAGPIVAKGLLLALLFVTLGRTLLKEGSGPATTALLIGGAILLCRFRFIVRPDLVTYAGLVAVASIVSDFRSNRKDRLRHLPWLFLVWVQFHSGAIFGLLLLAGIWLGEMGAARLAPGTARLDADGRRRLLIWTAISLVISCCNPNHIKYLSFAVGHVEDYAKFAIQELRPLDWGEDRAILLAMVITLLAGLLAWRSDPAALLVLLPVAYASFRTVRLFPVFALLALPVLGRAIQAARLEKRPTWRLAAWGGAALFLVLIFRGLPPGQSAGLYQFGTGTNEKLMPVAAANAIERIDPAGSLFNSNIYGGYLIWRFRGERKVFTDGRSQLHEETLTWIRDHRWDEIIEKYEIGYCLVDYGAGNPRLPGDEMTLVWWDDKSLLFVASEQVEARSIPHYTVYYPVMTAGEIAAALPPEVREEELRRALHEAPGSVLARFLLATLLSERSQWTEGAELLGEAIDIAPWRGDLRISRGAMLARSGNREEAIAEIRKGVRSEPGDPSAWAGLGRLLSDAKDQRAAQKALERAVELAPTNRGYALDLGLVYERGGESGGAEQVYRRILAADPTDAEAQRRLARLTGRAP